MSRSEALKRAQQNYAQSDHGAEVKREIMRRLREDPDYKAKEREYKREWRRRKKARADSSTRDNTAE
jgi:hypothetical protein